MEKRKGNFTNHPKKFMRWDDWQAWLLREWLPFKTNALPHIIGDMTNLKNDMKWVKVLLIVILGAIITAAIALLSKG